jgi:hypothetical protein
LIPPRIRSKIHAGQIGVNRRKFKIPAKIDMEVLKLGHSSAAQRAGLRADDRIQNADFVLDLGWLGHLDSNQD